MSNTDFILFVILCLFTQPLDYSNNNVATFILSTFIAGILQTIPDAFWCEISPLLYKVIFIIKLKKLTSRPWNWKMSQTWRPVIQSDLDDYMRKLLQFRDLFYSSIGPKSNYKIFVPSADGAPNKCTSTSTRIVSSLKGVYSVQ